MEFETNVISTEIIKPSSPTPQKHQFSLLDQSSPLVLTPIIYFYSSNPKIPNSQKTKLLKKSLSETLPTYYPLAGRPVDNLYIDCNDGGVPFLEAEADCNLSPFINNPNVSNMTKFCPFKLTAPQNICMAVQVTYFRCGGIAVGVAICRKIADALSFISFVNSWSAVARDGDLGDMPRLKFDGAAYFPPKNIPGMSITSLSLEEGTAAKIFKFPNEKVALLQEIYSSDGGKRRPSRVQALIVHIFLSATGMQPDPNKIFSITQAVNLRTQLGGLPPSEYRFGSFAGASTAMVAAGDGGAEVLQKVKQSNKAVYDTYMDRMKEAGEKGKNLLNELLGYSHERDKHINLVFTTTK